MVIFILELLKMEEEMDWAYKSFHKINTISDNSKTIFFMDKDFIIGTKTNSF